MHTYAYIIIIYNCYNYNSHPTTWILLVVADWWPSPNMGYNPHIMFHITNNLSHSLKPVHQSFWPKKILQSMDFTQGTWQKPWKSKLVKSSCDHCPCCFAYTEAQCSSLATAPPFCPWVTSWHPISAIETNCGNKKPHILCTVTSLSLHVQLSTWYEHHLSVANLRLDTLALQSGKCQAGYVLFSSFSEFIAWTSPINLPVAMIHWSKEIQGTGVSLRRTRISWNAAKNRTSPDPCRIDPSLGARLPLDVSGDGSWGTNGPIGGMGWWLLNHSPHHFLGAIRGNHLGQVKVSKLSSNGNSDHFFHAESCISWNF